MDNISTRIARARELKGMSQSQLARELGVSPQAVQNWESGKSGPKGQRIVEVAKLLGVSIRFLLDGTKNFQDYGSDTGSPLFDRELQTVSVWDDQTPLEDGEVRVPFLKEVELSAGSGRFAIEDAGDAHLRFLKKDLRHNNVQFDQARCVTVRGSSMVPVLRDGATVGVNVGKNTLGDIIDADMYAINHNGQLRVKQVFRLPSGLRLRSFNRDEYPDEDYTFQEIQEEQISILGHVFWWGMFSR